MREWPRKLGISLSIVSSLLAAASSNGVQLSRQWPTNMVQNDFDKRPLTEEELRLMYQIALYRSRLDLAYRVAKRALKLHPDSLYWHERAAQTAQWTDRPREAMKYWFYVYKHRPDPELRQRLLKVATTYYQYDAAAPLAKEELDNNLSRSNLERFIRLQSAAGKPAEAARTLEELYRKNSAKRMLLTEALRLYLELGDLHSAARVVEEMNRKRFTSLESRALRLAYYYSRRNLNKAFAMTEGVNLQTLKDEWFLRQISDLGWYLGRRKKAGEASYRLYRLGRARQVDYERILHGYPLSEKEISTLVNKGWKSNPHPYMFYNFAYYLLDHKYYKVLQTLFTLTESLNSQETPALRKDPLYYVIKAQMANALGRKELAKGALEEAYRLAPDNHEIILSLFWLALDNKDEISLKKLLARVERCCIAEPLFWPVLAAAYLELHKGDKALEMLRRILEKRPDDLEARLMHAYLLLALDRTDVGVGEMRWVFERLRIQAEHNPSLLKQENFLQKYLSTAIYVLPPDRFETQMRKSRPYLSPERYRNLLFSWAQRRNGTERMRQILQRMRHPEPWMRLSLALQEQDRTLTQDLLYHYYVELPIRDRVEAGKVTGSYAFAYSLAFKGLDENSEDHLLYYQLLQITQERADRIELNVGYLSRGKALERAVLEMKGRHYLAHGMWILPKMEYYRNRETDRKMLVNAPEWDKQVQVKLLKEDDRGSVDLGVGYRESMEAYPWIDAGLRWRLSDRFRVDLSAGWQSEAEETIYTLLGGNKDFVSTTLAYSLFPSTELSWLLEGMRYRSQGDGDELGTGVHTLLQYTRYLRQGYPDISAATFIEYGHYNEEERHGFREIDTLLPAGGKILPENFINVGMTLQYGAQAHERFAQDWKPFFLFTPLYNVKNGQFSFGCKGGIAGSMGMEDMINVNFEYDQSLYGIEEKSFKLFLDYKKLY